MKPFRLRVKGRFSRVDGFDLTGHVAGAVADYATAQALWEHGQSYLSRSRRADFDDQLWRTGHRWCRLAGRASISAVHDLKEALDRLCVDDHVAKVARDELVVLFPDIVAQRHSVSHPLERRMRLFGLANPRKAELPRTNGAISLSSLIALEGLVRDEHYVVAIERRLVGQPSTVIEASFPMTRAMVGMVVALVQRAFDSVDDGDEEVLIF